MGSSKRDALQEAPCLASSFFKMGARRARLEQKTCSSMERAVIGCALMCCLPQSSVLGGSYLLRPRCSLTLQSPIGCTAPLDASTGCIAELPCGYPSAGTADGPLFFPIRRAEFQAGASTLGSLPCSNGAQQHPHLSYRLPTTLHANLTVLQS